MSSARTVEGLEFDVVDDDVLCLGILSGGHPRRGLDFPSRLRVIGCLQVRGSLQAVMRGGR